jgi:hypothetical protein
MEDKKQHKRSYSINQDKEALPAINIEVGSDKFVSEKPLS